MHVFTDIQTLWNSVNPFCNTEENRLSINVAGSRQVYRTGERAILDACKRDTIRQTP
jgi:hypothetical protein